LNQGKSNSFEDPEKQYKLRSISNIQTRKGCTRIIVVVTEEHKLRNIRKGTS
jgi:hypothetical protein